MTPSKTPPVACTLDGDNFRERILWIAELMRNALRSYKQTGLVLDLRFAAEAADRVREMVRKEQECCSFLAFEVSGDAKEVRVIITAPETARSTATVLFQEFVACAVNSQGDMESEGPGE